MVGDLFQQYAVKYAGITRGIPLSNTNQLWGLLWGILVFGELRGGPHDVLVKVILGSVVMASGAGVIALSSVSRAEHARWREAALREGERYGVDAAYTEARGAGREPGTTTFRRSWIDWLVVAAATATLIGFATIAEAPQIAVHWGWAAVLAAATLAVLAGCAIALWRTTRFS